MATQRSLEERFWEKVRKGPGENDCWEWTGGLSEGYGHLRIDGRDEKAHRLSWKMHRGEIPRGKCVLHTCDNRPCIRSTHLYVGTKKRNALDREERGRGNHATGQRHGCATHPGLHKGERNGRAKLTEQLVRELRILHARDGVKKAELARRFVLSRTAVGDIISRKLWPEVA